MNVLLEKSKLPFEAIAFDQIKIEYFIPAVEHVLIHARELIAKFKKSQGVSFDEVIIPLEAVSHEVDGVSSIFFNLHSAECPDELQKIAPIISDKLTAFSSDVSLDEKIFERVKKCYEVKGGRILTAEEKTYLEETYQGFVRNGANLSSEKKDRLRIIDEELAKLSLEYSQNVLKSTNQYLLVLDSKDRLDGLPEAAIEAMSEMADKKGHKGKWAITLDAPMYVPVVTYAKDRALRSEIAVAYAKRAFNNEFDNQENIKKIIKLKYERANLLGYKSHAHYALEDRMAKSPEKVMDFLEELRVKAMPFAQKEMDKLKKLAMKDGIQDMQAYDTAYYSEILKKIELNFDEEELRPYFKLENVINGVFNVAKKLYGLDFKENNNLPAYHPDVKAYEVYDSAQKFIGLFYADFFPRETKRGGAWMTSYKTQGFVNGNMRRPHISIVCNFTKPTKTKPSLLSIDEVLTLYHEFGHALHGLLSNCHYTKMSGTNVYWDFVELPSQMLENWVYEKECLDLFAVHFENGNKMPKELIEKVKKSASFREGISTMRQLTFSILDMNYHLTNPDQISDIDAFEKEINKKTELLPPLAGTNMSCSFAHIFAGGYSAGYYSYKWAEVLDADAFDYFQQEGIFNSSVASKFREHILEKGGSEHPMELYKRFRGKEPSIDPLLKRAGLA